MSLASFPGYSESSLIPRPSHCPVLEDDKSASCLVTNILVPTSIPDPLQVGGLAKYPGQAASVTHINLLCCGCAAASSTY